MHRRWHVPRFREVPLALVCLLAACADAARSGRVERADSAGVEIVRNLGPDRPLAWRFEPVLSLGGKDQGPEAFYRLSAGGVGVDGAGNLFVLDDANHRVVVFDSAGRHLRSMGRSGGGPGEIGRAWMMAVSPDGTASVFDISKQSLVRWDSSGRALPSRPLPFPPTSGFALQGEALVAPVPAPRSDDGTMRERLLVMRDADTTELATLVQPTPPMLEFGCVGIMLPPCSRPPWSGARRTSASRSRRRRRMWWRFAVEASSGAFVETWNRGPSRGRWRSRRWARR